MPVLYEENEIAMFLFFSSISPVLFSPNLFFISTVN